MNEQDEVIAFLSRPSAYGPGVGEVERIDTHAAVVFLAGERAYKLKRAIRFSYLDYGTIERRERFCRAELELNRRTAPEIYLGVTPVVRTECGLALGGAGQPVDWVLEMRRFDQARLFDRLAERGALDAITMRNLADRIAAFHDAAERDHEFGGAEGIAVEIASNDENLKLAVPELFEAGRVQQLTKISTETLERMRALLDRRRAGGDVRVCHGDLHLRNIVLLDGRPTLFDAIEFSPRMNRIDVLYDLAFLLMDLEHRGKRPLANAALNRYLDLTAQDGGLAALPLFLSVRAAIRAHVGAAAARALPADHRLKTEARAYVEAAIRFLEPAPPLLLAIGGLSGAGKSTLAQTLAPGIGRPPGARVLRSDVIRKRSFGVAPEERLPDKAYGGQVTRRVYRLQAEAAALALKAGHAAVADAVFAKPEQRRAIEAVARAAGAPFLGLWLEAPAETLIERVAARRRDASDATPRAVRQQLGYDIGPLDWRRLEAGGDAATVAERAAELLAQPGSWLRDAAGPGGK